MTVFRKFLLLSFPVALFFLVPATAWARLDQFYPPDGAYLKDNRPLFAWEGRPATLEISRNGYFSPPDYSFLIKDKFSSLADWSGYQFQQVLPDGQYFWRLKQGAEISRVFSFTLDPSSKYFFLGEKELADIVQPYQAAEAKGTFHLILESDSQPQIYYLASANQGQTWSEPQNLSRQPYPCRQPCLLVTPESVIAAWLVEEGSQTKIGLSYKLADSEIWNGPFYFSRPGQKITDFSLAAAETGPNSLTEQIFLTYTSETADTRPSIYLVKPVGHGEGWSVPRRLGQPDLSARHPKIIASNGAAYLFWAALTAQDNEELFAAVSRDSGLSWSEPIALTYQSKPDGQNPDPLRKRIPFYQIVRGQSGFDLAWEELAAFADQKIKFGALDLTGNTYLSKIKMKIATLATKENILSPGFNWLADQVAAKAQLDLLSPPRHPDLWVGGRQLLAVWQQIDTDLTSQIYLKQAAVQDLGSNWTPAQIISWPNFNGAGWPVLARSARPYLIWSSAQNDRLMLNFIDLAKWPYARAID